MMLSAPARFVVVARCAVGQVVSGCGGQGRVAFTNNLHELAYHVRCTDGTELDATIMVAFGAPGEFMRSCDTPTVIAAAAATPANSPTGSGVRFIPDRSCIDLCILVAAGQCSLFSEGLYEDWVSGNHITTAGGQEPAYFDPHFVVFAPSRYYESTLAALTGRSMEACYETEGNGDLAAGGACAASTSNGQNLNVTWHDPRSTLNGLTREVYFNQTTVVNPGGPTPWYTDPFGGHASTTGFPGSVHQQIAAMDNRRALPLESQAFGATRSYGGNSAHAPN